MSVVKLNPEIWVEEYSDALYNYAMARVMSEEYARDLVQETFLSALRTYENFRGESSEKTWLIAILKRKIVDYYRKQSRARVQSIDGGSADYFAEDGDRQGEWLLEKAPKSWTDDLGQLMDNEEFMHVFSHCLSKLPEKWAACFAMKNLEDYDAAEICKELDITPSNYWVILHRARLRLRECIEKSWFNQH